MSVFNFPLYPKDALNSEYCYRLIKLIAFNFSFINFISKRYAWFYTITCNDIKTKKKEILGEKALALIFSTTKSWCVFNYKLARFNH